MKRAWVIFLAWTHLSKTAVCEASKGRADFHDYPDGIIKEPMHGYIYTCERCGKHFGI